MNNKLCAKKIFVQSVEKMLIIILKNLVNITEYQRSVAVNQE